MEPAEIVRIFYEEIISCNALQRASEFIAPDCRLRIGRQTILIGAEGMAEHIAATKQTYPDYEIKILRQFCDGEYVVSECVMQGTHAGEWLGIRPSGKKLSILAVNIDRIQNGKIVEHGGAANTFETLWEAGLIGAKESDSGPAVDKAGGDTV